MPEIQTAQQQPDQVSAFTTPEQTPVPEQIIKPLEENSSTTTVEKSHRKLPRWLKWFFIITGTIFILFFFSSLALASLVYIYILPPVRELQQTVPPIQQQADNLKNAIKEQNLTTAKLELANIKTSIKKVQNIANQISWVKKFPHTEPYWQDSQHLLNGSMALIEAGNITIESLIPYADLLGFQATTKSPADETKNESDAGNDELPDTATNKKPETAEDRIQFVVNTLSTLVPQLDNISKHLNTANQEFKQIDPLRYPEYITFDNLPFSLPLPPGNIPIRNHITQIINLTDQATTLATDARPLLEVAPYILGNDSQRTYLVLFQNDAELRPTGGFLTAYALLTVNKGSVKPGISKDIYDLDARYTSKLPAPDPLIKYIPDPYAKEKTSGRTPKLRIRDSNLSPDFKTAMDLFHSEYLQTNSPQIDGIIGVDTQLLLNLLKVTGPIGVGGVGNFSSEIIDTCNCPQVVFALESAISVETPYIRENRKAIIGPLMHSVLANAMGTPKEKISLLVQAILDAIEQKHLILYFNDPKVQQAIESFNLAGKIRQPADPNSDYLMIVDTNFAGAKSNLYVEDQIDLKINTSNSNSIHELTITYKNPQKHDGWLNGDFRNWVRIFVPEGSKLLESNGSETDMTTNENLGKTTFEGFLVVRPEGLAKLTLKYETPSTQSNPYKVLVQKQGGTKNFQYTVTVDGQAQTFNLDEDKDLVFN